MKLFWYDSETSGKEASKHQMLTFAVVCTDLSLNVLDQMYLKIQLLPTVTPEAGALAVNKLDPFSPEWNTNAVSEKDFCQKLTDFYKKNSASDEPCVWLAYNARFDNDFLGETYFRNKMELNLEKDVCVDPLIMCREATRADKILTPLRESNYPGKPPFRSSALIDVSKALNTEHIGDAHNALNDVLCMIRTIPAALAALTGQPANMEAFVANKSYQIGF